MKPITLGFLANIYDDPFANSPTNGFLEMTRNLNTRIVLFPFPSQRNSIGQEDKQNLILQVIDQRSVDGLIVSGFFSHGVDEEVFRTFCNRFAPLPVVTLGVKVEGVPGVVTDMESGLDALMTHLLDEHGYRSLGFLGGPPGQQEADQRRAVFEGALARRGLSPAGPELNGDFSYESGVVVARRLLADGPLPFDGLVCANDSMALGAKLVFEQAGLRVPQDVFLTGFDDYHAQTLTTVQQSSFEQMRSAVSLLLATLRQRRLVEQVSLPSKLVVRSSCGCGVEQRFRRALQRPGASGPLVDELVAAFAATLAQGGSRFQTALEQLLAHPSSHSPGETWRVLEPALRKARPGAETEQLLAQARYTLSEHEETLKSQQLHLVSRQSFQLREFTQALGNALNLADSFEVIAHELPGMGITGCWISLLDEPDGSFGTSTLRMAFDETGRWPLPPEGVRFPSSELRPGGCHAVGPGHWLMFAEVLQSRDQVFGLILMSATLEAGALCEALRLQISSSLQAARVWEERKRQEARLIESEKMAALGALVAGVAHEINTPVGIGITASSDLRVRVAQLRAHLAADQLGRNELQTFLDDASEESAIIETNLMRAGELIQSFKQIAVDQTHEESRPFALAEYLHHIVQSLRSRLRPGHHRCEIVCPPELMLDGPPGTLVQIVSNLIDNSLLHGFDDRVEGTIRLVATAAGGEVVLEYSDDGVGIEEANLGRIFEPFYTTKRGRGGSGLGLAIVYNLVVQVWSGRVEVASSPGKGTRFTLHLAPHAAKS